MSERLLDFLLQLYPPEQAHPAYERLMYLMEQAKQRLEPLPEKPLFSEKDVVLITYGDSLQKAGEAPLQTLRQFAEEKLAGVISTIHILPFYPYSSDDGFSVKDFYAVNPSLGDWSDVEQLGQKFTLMFDAVFNHMSAQSGWFREFLADNPEFNGLFRTESPETDLSAVTRPRALPLLTEFTKPNGETVYLWTTFSADQIDFDARYPNTILRLIDILLFYVKKGASIIRLDAIAYLWKIAGTSSIHLPQTHTVIQLMRAVLDEVAPQVVVITETNVPHAENISYFGDGTNEAQLVYNFTLPPLLFHSLLTGNANKLREWVNTLDTPSERTTFFNFTASHDGIGVRPVEDILDKSELQALIAHVESRGGRVSYKRNADGTHSPYELNITYIDAVTDPHESEDMQVKRFVVSQAIMLSLAGVPAIYIHSLLGSHNDIEGMIQSGHNRTINRAKLSMTDIQTTLGNKNSFRAKVFEAYRHLIQTRIQHSTFHPNAHQQALDVGNEAVFALRRWNDNENFLCLHNLTAYPHIIIVEQSGIEILTSTTIGGQVTLAPYEVCWIKLFSNSA